MKNVLTKMAENAAKNLQYTIVALGDSVTDGCFRGDEEKDFEAVYHARLKKKLNCIFPNLRINMIDSGIGGINTPNSVGRLERDVFAYNPDLVIVCLGLNDIVNGSKTYIENLEKIFADIRGRGIEAIFLTPNMVCTEAETEQIERQFGSDKYNDFAATLARLQTGGPVDEMFSLAKELATKYGITVCDSYGAWRNLYDCGANTTNLLCNFINHPSREMHELFASMLFTTILTTEA